LSAVRRAVVIGGTGTVGREVVRSLRCAGLDVVFTHHRNGDRAAGLTAELGATTVRLDLMDGQAVRRFAGDPFGDGRGADVLVHAAAVLHGADGEPVTDAELREMMVVNVESALVAVEAFAASCPGEGDIVLVTALDRGQSLPIPPGFAATQGALGALVMSLAKELGPRGHKINAVALGLLGEGLSSTLPKRLRDDYLRFSALRRLGVPAEAAKAIAWLALSSSYMSGKVLSVNGGL
jgi:3-oxoacyl-[acyl-carrier protein] reductase